MNQGEEKVQNALLFYDRSHRINCKLLYRRVSLAGVVEKCFSTGLFFSDGGQSGISSGILYACVLFYSKNNDFYRGENLKN